jgi:hypothetical protein
MKALIKLPDVNTLVRQDRMPKELTEVAMKFATTGIDITKLEGPQVFEFIRLTYVLIADSLQYIATADSAAWDEFTRTGESPTVEGWEAISIDGAELSELRVDQADLEALGSIVGRVKTPNEITIASRLDRNVPPKEGAGPPAETVGTYAPFRQEPGSSDRGADGADVRSASVAPARSGRPGRRSGTRSGTRS